MSGWMAEMADAVDAHVPAQAPPTSKAAGPPSMQTVSIDDTPTEPATSPRELEVQRMMDDGHKQSMQHWSAGQVSPLITETLINLGDGNLKTPCKGSMKRMREVFKNGKGELPPGESQITVTFHVVHLQQDLRLCAHFLKSMQHFVK